MGFRYGKKSSAKLEAGHPALVKLAMRVIEITPYDIAILRVMTTPELQQALVDSGASQSMDSYHLPQHDGKAHALDYGVLVGGKYINGDTKEEMGYYRKVNQAFVTAAIELDIQIELGGLWRDFVDAGHIQLNRKYYGR